MEQLFKTLSQNLSQGTDATIVVRKVADDRLAVSISFKNTKVDDSAKELIAPFVVTGSPEELDAEFASLIVAPMEISTGLQNSMEQFEAAAKVAKSKSAAAAEQKKKDDAAKNAAKTQYDKCMAAGKASEDKKDFASAKKSYQEAASLIQNDVLKKRAEQAAERCEKKMVPDIFSMDADDEPETVEKSPAVQQPEEPEESEETASPEESSEEETAPSEESQEATQEEPSNPLDFGD